MKLSTIFLLAIVLVCAPMFQNHAFSQNSNQVGGQKQAGGKGMKRREGGGQKGRGGEARKEKRLQLIIFSLSCFVTLAVSVISVAAAPIACMVVGKPDTGNHVPVVEERF